VTIERQRFSGKAILSDEAQDALYGDLLEPKEEEASAPATEVDETAVVEPPVELAPPADEPAQLGADEGVVEPAPGEADTPAEEVPEPALDEVPPLGEDETWKKRYADSRTENNQALDQARKRAEFAEQQLARFITDTQSASISPERLAELTTQAEEAGLDAQQVGVYADISSEAVKAREAVMQQTLQSQAEQARQDAVDAENAIRAQTMAVFNENHPDLEEVMPVLDIPNATKATAIAKFLHDIDEAQFMDANGNALPFEVPFEEKLAMQQRGEVALQPRAQLNPDMLEFAYHAVVLEPALGRVLTAQPGLMDTPEGMEYARRLASQMTVPATTRPNVEAIDASLASAATLTGPSAPAPVVPEPDFILPEKKFFSR
jgi:hypothetical protein